VAGFEVLETPGHSPGHIAFWRQSELDQRAHGHPRPPRAARLLTSDPEENRRSARRLAALEPKLALFGHGPPLRDTRKLVDFVDGLDGHP
jgi:hydroxyacylglutathione hydrolase